MNGIDIWDFYTPADVNAAVADAVKAKASAEAAEILASRGINKSLDNAKAAAGSTGDTAKEIVDKFNSMAPGPERSAFFAKHRAVLVG